MVTVELRWFAPGPLDDRTLRAFAGRGGVEDRTDAYQLGLGDEHGLKRRGRAGLLEHKHRVAQVPVQVPLASHTLAGVVERWHKRWPDPATPGPALQTEGDVERWAQVRKRRATRAVGGCRAELTALTGPGLAGPQWTLAVELDQPDAIDALVDAALELFAREPKLAAQVIEAESCGYPAWLARRWRG